jgi:E1-E2 ATPase/Cation transporter/ATPase, N-terminus
MSRGLQQFGVDLGSSRKGIPAHAIAIVSSALRNFGKVRRSDSSTVSMLDGTLSKFWLWSTDALGARLASTPEGLDQAEAERRLADLGRNVLASGHRPGLAKRIWRRIAEPLVAILAVAAVLSIFFGDAVSAFIILLVLILSTTLDLAQEHKAERAVDRLRKSVAIMVDVLRSGQVAQVASEAIVPGDVVRLKAGDLVPADGLILSEAHARANETVLTGEAYPAGTIALRPSGKATGTSIRTRGKMRRPNMRAPGGSHGLTGWGDSPASRQAHQAWAAQRKGCPYLGQRPVVMCSSRESCPYPVRGPQHRSTHQRANDRAPCSRH